MAKLINVAAHKDGLERDDDYGKHWTIKGEYVLIGRSPISDIVLNSSLVSRLHCFVLKDKENFYLGDFCSTYGTWYPIGKRGHFPTQLHDRLPHIIDSSWFYYEIAKSSVEEQRKAISDLLCTSSKKKALIESGNLCLLENKKIFGILPDYRFMFVSED